MTQIPTDTPMTVRHEQPVNIVPAHIGEYNPMGLGGDYLYLGGVLLFECDRENETSESFQERIRQALAEIQLPKYTDCEVVPGASIYAHMSWDATDVAQIIVAWRVPYRSTKGGD